MNALHQQGQMWLEKGIAAARGGRRLEAREALFRALNDESQREMAWLWLAAVADDKRQERLYLEKVLAINPENPYARSGLEKLNARSPEEEPVPPIAQESSPSTIPTVRQASAPPAAPRVPADGDGNAVSSTAPSKAVPGLTTASVPDNTVEISPIPNGEPAGETRESSGRVEPSGWTTRSEPVKPRRTGMEPSGWTRATPRVAPGLPVGIGYTGTARPAMSSVALAAPHADGVKPSVVWNDVFSSHENWTVTMAALSLILLALLLVGLAIMTALTG